jgi:signal transduction histidine kinase
MDRLDRTLVISNWLRSPLPPDAEELTSEALQNATAIFGCSRALLVWEETEEPWQNVDAWLHGERHSERGPRRYHPVVDERVGRHHFHTPDALGNEQVVVFGTDEFPRQIPGPVVHEVLARRFQMRSILSLDLHGQTIDGRLFLLNPARIDRFLSEIAASIVVSRFDMQASIQTARSDAVTEQMLRVARDLHDGLLQSFTGVVLQLETVHQILESDPVQAQKMITQLEAVLMADQRELRAYLQKLRPGPRVRMTEQDFNLRARLGDLVRRYKDQWDLEVSFDLEPMDRTLLESLGWETYRIIAEAVSNSAKHGEAKRVGITVGTEGDRLRIVVEDDGKGLAIKGRYNLVELSAKRQGPTVLGERVASLNGDGVLESSDNGLKIAITLPLGWKGYT